LQNINSRLATLESRSFRWANTLKIWSYAYKYAVAYEQH
jgi:hypothetical protein